MPYQPSLPAFAYDVSASGGGPPPPGGGVPHYFYPDPNDPLVSADYAGWWRRSFRLLAATWRPMTLIQLFWAIPLLVGGIVPTFLIGWPTTGTTDAEQAADDLLPIFAIVAPIALLFGLLALVTRLATIDILIQHATVGRVDIGRAMRIGLRRLPAYLGWGILGGLLTLVGLLFCFLPGFYVTAVLAVLPVIVVLERGRAIRRAFELFHADFGAALGRIATIGGLGIAASVVFTLPLQIAAPLLVSDTATGIVFAVVSSIVYMAVNIAVPVVGTPMLLTAYADMRARREPFSTAYLYPAEPTPA